MRRPIFIFLICLGSCFLVSGGIALYRHTDNMKEFRDINMYVSIGMAFLGGACITNNSKGSHIYIDAEEPSRNHHDMIENEQQGIAFGWIAFVAGIASGTICYFLPV